MRNAAPHRFGLAVLLASLLATMSACVREGPPAPVAGYADARRGSSGPGEYRVGRGDTLYGIAQKAGIPVREIIDLNALRPPYKLVEGQRLRLPQARYYRVVAGDTVYGISRATRVDAASLMRLNDMKPPYAVKVGQLLRLPAPVQVAAARPVARPTPGASLGASASAPPAGALRPSGQAAMPAGAMPRPPAGTLAQGQPGDQGRLVARIEASGNVHPGNPSPGASPSPSPPLAPASSPGAPPSEMQAASPDPAGARDVGADMAVEGASAPDAAGADLSGAETAAIPLSPPPRTSGQFGWPVAGKIIARFGPAASGTHNDGINIAAPLGTAVGASEDGVVAYAGNELRGFGNLLLVRHQGGWMTAYAHNGELLVKRGDRVRRGQTIARVGRTGNVTSPQLHFEVRKGTDAVDPLKYLGAPPNSLTRAGYSGDRPGPG